MKIKTDNIFQVIELDSSVPDVYKALTDANLLTKLTGMAAKMDDNEGGKFMAWNNKCHGYILHLSANKRIVQSWTHDEFRVGMYTTVIFDIEEMEHGCRVSFNHIGVPEEHSGWLTEAWKKDFWIPLSEHLTDKVLS
jgi:activator of HSP90 ATPase